MTTPERLRRRQIRNDWFIAVLAVMLCASVVFFRLSDAAQRACFERYVQNQSEVGKFRSELTERESRAVRKVIRGSGNVTSREEFEALLTAYDKALRKIDREREENPLPVFDPEQC